MDAACVFGMENRLLPRFLLFSTFESHLTLDAQAFLGTALWVF
jgi:hypothetical protein